MKKVDYLSGIQRAETEGRIVYAGTGQSDIHGAVPPEGSLSHFNIRSLDDSAMRLLSSTKKQGQQQVLILGSGTGNEGYSVRSILPDAKVDGVALSPCDPYTRVILSSLEIHQQVAALIHPDTLEERRMETAYGALHEKQRQEYIQMTDEEYEQEKRCVIGSEPRTDLGIHVPTSLVQELQNEGRIQAFEHLTVPSLDRQYVGKFPDDLIPDGKYDFIYDGHGPLYYMEMEKRGTEKDSLIHAYDLLSERGMLYAAQFWPANRAIGVHRVISERERDDSDTLFLQGNDTRLVIIQPGNALYEKARATLSKRGYRSEAGVTKLKNDTEEIFRLILQPAR